MSDLSISQSMQESAPEHERLVIFDSPLMVILEVQNPSYNAILRGAIFGVQSAMQSAFNLLKNLLVIILPDIRTFGLLIMVSWTSVFFAFCSYTVYLIKDLRRDRTVPNSTASTHPDTSKEAVVDDHEVDRTTVEQSTLQVQDKLSE